MSQRISPLVRGMLALLILAYLVTQLDGEATRKALAMTLPNWPWLVAGTVMTFLGLCMGVFRWAIILTAEGIRLPFTKIFSIFFIGQFFNAFLFGACGGDIARAICIARKIQDKKMEGVSSVFIDRAIGLFTLMIFCCALIVLRLRLFMQVEETRSIGVGLLIFVVVAVVGMAALFRRNLFEHFPPFQALEQQPRIGPLIRRAYEAVYIIRKKPWLWIPTISFSLLNLVFLTLACMAFGNSLNIDVRAVDYFTFFPVIIVVAAIPITPGGLGIREGLFVSMFGTLGVSQSPALLLSLLVYLGGGFWSLLGGVLFYRTSDTKPGDLAKEYEALQIEQV